MNVLDYQPWIFLLVVNITYFTLLTLEESNSSFILFKSTKLVVFGTIIARLHGTRCWNRSELTPREPNYRMNFWFCLFVLFLDSLVGIVAFICIPFSFNVFHLLI